MQEQSKGRRFSFGLIAGVSTAAIVAGGAATWWAWNSLTASDSTPHQESEVRTTTRDPQRQQPASEQMAARVYWLKPTEQSFELVANQIAIEGSDQPQAVLEYALESLLAGANNPTYTTTIPKGTQLRNLSIEPDGVHVDLSEEFTFGGGSASMIGRLAQVLYTATSLDPDTPVWIEVEDQPLEYLGGEGVRVAQPLTREEFEQNFEL